LFAINRTDVELKRFDIVVFNHERLDSWFRNANRIEGLVPSIDRITIVSCSPSEKERALVRDFEAQRGWRIRYLTRENRGFDQLARIEYFTEVVGTLEENLSYDFIFQMQDHYLDTESTFSRWGPERNHRVKGDVVPDGTVFSLPSLYQKMCAENLSGAFCDRNNPCWFRVGRRGYIAPNGGNFIIRTSEVRKSQVSALCRSLRNVCDNSYSWAVYVEYMWGTAFFKEGRKFYDIRQNRVFSSWDPNLFYISPDNIADLRAYYGSGVMSGLGRRYRAVRTKGKSVQHQLRASLGRAQAWFPVNSWKGRRS